MSIQFFSERPFGCEPVRPFDGNLDLAFRFWFKADKVDEACDIVWPRQAYFHFHADGTLSVVAPKGKVFVTMGNEWARAAARIGYQAAIVLNVREREYTAENFYGLDVCGFPDHGRPEINLSSLGSSTANPVNVKFDKTAKLWIFPNKNDPNRIHLIHPDVLPYAHFLFPDGMPCEKLHSFEIEF